MKNILLLIAFIIAMGLSLVFEPVSDSIDVVAGATNTTYNPSIDQTAGATRGNDDDDDDDEHDDDDDDEYEDD
ncbi:MAG: hypothetical protein K9L02_03655 [Acholeplasmataceae bacterium]|nr:hypothetical protein [Acholeplasmataceae bacterium]